MNAPESIQKMLSIKKQHRNATPQQQLNYRYLSCEQVDNRTNLGGYLARQMTRENETDVYFTSYYSHSEHVNHSRQLGFSFNFEHSVIISTHDFVDFEIAIV